MKRRLVAPLKTKKNERLYEGVDEFHLFVGVQKCCKNLEEIFKDHPSRDTIFPDADRRLDERSLPRLKENRKWVPAHQRKLFDMSVKALKETLEEVTERYLNFAIRHAKRLGYKHKYLLGDPISQESAGQWALIRAFFRFTPDKKFGTYLVWWIRQSLQRERIRVHKEEETLDAPIGFYDDSSAPVRMIDVYVSEIDDPAYSCELVDKYIEDDILTLLEDIQDPVLKEKANEWWVSGGGWTDDSDIRNFAADAAYKLKLVEFN